MDPMNSGGVSISFMRMLNIKKKTFLKALYVTTIEIGSVITR